ncbi:MAG: transketolase family protein, partial [Clostridia bacterium]
MKKSNQRTVYGQTLVEIGQRNPQLVVLEADLGKSTQTNAFQQAFPQRYFEMGIAEANMTSFAAGLSLTGKVAVTNSFAVFAAGRAYDQIRQGVAIPALNVKVGSSAGFSDFGDGATHQSVDDVAIMRAIPNMTVLVPADAPQLRSMVYWMVAHDGPVYLRVSRNDLPEVTGETPDPLAPAVLREGSDVAAVACGVMVEQALLAADLLAA